VTSAAATVSVVNTATPGRLVNISTRSPVGAGSDVLIGGFFIAGSTPKQVLVRAAGPALTGLIADPLADPMIEIFDQDTGAIVESNDDWDAALAPVFNNVGAFGWTTGSKDAALLVTLDPGAYTAIAKGAGGGTGNALIEVYEVPGGDPASRLVNISTRSLVGTGNDVQIGGFAIAGSTARTVVIRASGPALNALVGLNGIVDDPMIELTIQSNGQPIAATDDWAGDLEPQFNAVGAFPWTPGSRDAALVTSLPPGGYTVTVRGKNGATGLALIEIYVEN
jgi:hypothetical protein